MSRDLRPALARSQDSQDVLLLIIIHTPVLHVPYGRQHGHDNKSDVQLHQMRTAFVVDIVGGRFTGVVSNYQNCRASWAPSKPYSVPWRTFFSVFPSAKDIGKDVRASHWAPQRHSLRFLSTATVQLQSRLASR
jgi:hypothetical protein